MNDSGVVVYDEIDRFRRPVAASVVERKDRVSPDVEAASKPGQLRDLGAGGVLEEHDQEAPRVGGIDGGVHLDERLAGEPDGDDFTVGVTSSEPGAEAFPASFGQVVPGAQQQPRPAG